MNYIKVISRKIPITSITRGEFIDFSNRLTSAAHSHNGFIKSCSYWDVKDSLSTTLYNDFKLYTFSEWESEECWKKWLNSESRKDVHKRSGDPVKSVEHTILYKKLPFNDTFLL